MSERPIFLYRLYRFMLVPGLIFFVVTGYYALTGPTPADANVTYAYGIRVLGALLAGPMTILLGLLVMRRVPGNVMGPVIAWYGCIVNAELSPAQFPLFLQATSPIFLMTLGLPAMGIILAYFPTGRVFSTAWQKWMNVLLAVYYPLTTIHYLGSPNVYGRMLPNPLFISALAVHPAILDIATVITNVFFLSSIAALVQRYRRASATERKQIRWMALMAIPLAFGIVMTLVAPDFMNAHTLAVELLSVIILSAPAVASGLSILMHHLWDIDILIRKTLIYSLLTAILAAIYFGAIVLAQQVFRAATGEIPDLVIVVSTLLIAALFAPLRRRIQNTIDRRLYRGKYDAEKTLERFSRTLRDEVNLDDLKSSLIGVVHETMQPARISLWMSEFVSSMPKARDK